MHVCVHPGELAISFSDNSSLKINCLCGNYKCTYQNDYNVM